MKQFATLFYRTRRGASAMIAIFTRDQAETEIKKLFKRRIEADLRPCGNQIERIGGVEQTADGKWTWWLDSAPFDETASE